MSTKTEYAISTYDNPFDPFTQFDEWMLYDKAKGYNSCEKLARIARTSDQLSDATNNSLIEYAIDRIVEIDPLGIYIKVSRPSPV